MIECKIFSSQSGKLGRPTVKYFTKVTRSYLPTLSTSCFLNIKVSLPQTRPPPIHSPATDPLIGTTHHRLNLPRCQHHPLIHLPEFFFFFFCFIAAWLYQFGFLDGVWVMGGWVCGLWWMVGMFCESWWWLSCGFWWVADMVCGYLKWIVVVTLLWVAVGGWPSFFIFFLSNVWI